MARVSIAIPTCNRPQALSVFLELLQPQLTTDCEVIVCDDSGNTETREMITARFPQVVYRQGPRNGPGPNRNACAAAATGEWLVFADDDCLPRATFLPAYLKAIAGKGNAGPVLEGTTYRQDDGRTSLLWESPHYTGGSLPPSCNFAIPRELFLKAGGFDARYVVSFEDMEFFARLKAMGVSIEYVPDAILDHPVRMLPSPSRLARRWEARVVSSLDFGAPTLEILVRLPKHVLMVILSRFRGRKLEGENLRAALKFCGEFFLMLWYLPGWARKHHHDARSAFWTKEVSAGKAPPRYGL